MPDNKDKNFINGFEQGEVAVYESNWVIQPNGNKQDREDAIKAVQEIVNHYGIGHSQVCIPDESPTCGHYECDEPVDKHDTPYYESEIWIDGAPDGHMSKDILYFCSDWHLMLYLHDKEAICPHTRDETVLDHLADPLVDLKHNCVYDNCDGSIEKHGEIASTWNGAYRKMMSQQSIKLKFQTRKLAKLIDDEDILEGLKEISEALWGRSITLSTDLSEMGLGDHIIQLWHKECRHPVGYNGCDKCLIFGSLISFVEYIREKFNIENMEEVL